MSGLVLVVFGFALVGAFDLTIAGSVCVLVGILLTVRGGGISDPIPDAHTETKEIQEDRWTP